MWYGNDEYSYCSNLVFVSIKNKSKANMIFIIGILLVICLNIMVCYFVFTARIAVITDTPNSAVETAR